MTLTELIQSWERVAKSLDSQRGATSHAEAAGIRRCIREAKALISKESPDEGFFIQRYPVHGVGEFHAMNDKAP